MKLVWSLMNDETDSMTPPDYVWVMPPDDANAYFTETPGSVKKRVIQWRGNPVLEIRLALIEAC